MIDRRSPSPASRSADVGPSSSEPERPSAPRLPGGSVVRIDEGRLLIRHRTGDPQAFAELVAVYRAPVFSYLARCGVLEEDRRDLFQDIFIRIHRAADRYQADRPLQPWVFTIVANVARNHLRKSRVRALVHGEPPASESPGSEPDGERTATGRQTLAWLEREIQTLSLAQREVLLLVAVENLPLKEAASILKLPLNTVKTHLRRARLTLMRRLAARENPGPKQASSESGTAQNRALETRDDTEAHDDTGTQVKR